MSKKVKNYHCLIYTLYKIVQETVDTFLKAAQVTRDD